MAKHELLTAIDEAMAALKTARKGLIAEGKLAAKGAKATSSIKATAGKPAPVRRGMSEEGRQRVAEAQRKRWAAKKRADKKAARLAA